MAAAEAGLAIDVKAVVDGEESRWEEVVDREIH